MTPATAVPGKNGHGGSQETPEAFEELLYHERALLACAMTSPADVAPFLPSVRAEHFHAQDHRKLWPIVAEKAALGETSTDLFDLCQRSGVRPMECSQIISAEYGSTAMAGSYVRFVLQAAAQRERRRLSESVLEGASAASISEVLERIGSMETPGTARNRFLNSSRPWPQYLTEDFASRGGPILGAGLLRQGDLAVLYGKPGLGKTWIAMQLAIAIDRGIEFFGLPTRAVRVGFIELELIGDVFQERLKSCLDGSPGVQLEIISAPLLKSAVDLMDDDCFSEFRTYAKGLDLIVIDALARAHTCEEVNLLPLMNRLDGLRREADCAILLLHHERKSGANDGGREVDDLDALRGHSSLQSHPTLLMRLKRHPAGMLELRFPKVSCSKTPDSIGLEQDPSGRLIRKELPEELGGKNRQAVLDALAAHPRGVSTKRLSETLSNSGATMKESTVRRHLSALSDSGLATKSGSTKGTLWTLVSPVVSNSLTDHRANPQADWYERDTSD